MIKKFFQWIAEKAGEALLQHTLVTGIISLGGLTAAAAYFWDTTKQVFYALRFFFLAPVTFPTWLILPIILISFCTLGILLLAARVARLEDKKANTATATVHSYTKDTFEGLVWRWQWIAGVPSHFVPYCPRCDCALTQTYSGIPHYGQTLHFDCPKCNFSKVIDMERALLETRMVQLIDHHLRTEQREGL